MKNLLIILLLGTGVHSISVPFLSSMMDMVTLVTDISDLATGRHDLTSGTLFKQKVDPTLIRVNELSDQINQMTNQLNLKMDKIMAAVIRDVPRSVQYANLMRKLIGYVTRIDELFDDYQYYVHEQGNFAWYTVEDFSRVTTSHRYGDVPDILRQMYHLFVPGQLDQRDESLLDSMAATLATAHRAERCNILKTSQQQLYNLYETVIITEIKGFVMATYSYGLLSIYHNATFDKEIRKVTAQTILRCSQYLKSVIDYLPKLPREILLCDPPEHIKGETYVTLNSIYQVVVSTYMVLLNTCSKGCSAINNNRYFRIHYRDKNDFWRPKKRCEGHMSNCIDIASANFCELDDTVEAHYSYIEGSEGLFGEKKECPEGGKEQSLTQFNSGGWCTTCLCECTEENPESTATRGFNLRPQMADIEKNMIVTGVRFEEKNRLIHLQIEQGKLLSSGQIDKDSIELKELEEFTYFKEIGDSRRGTFKKIEADETFYEGRDYFWIYEDYREINLDIVHSLEFGWVVTGLKMSVDPKNSKAIGLEVHLTPYNLTTGLLEPTDEKPSKWINYLDMPDDDNDRDPDKRVKLDVKERNSPINYQDNAPDHDDFAQIGFTYDNIKKNAGQLTIPFLDKRVAAPYPRVPLEGVSLYHRGREKSGGFIGFAMNTVDITKFLNPEMSPEVLQIFKNNYQINNDVVEVE